MGEGSRRGKSNNWFVNLDIQKMTAAAVMLVVLAGGILEIEEWWNRRQTE